LKALAQPKLFRALLRSTYQHDWIVYAKRPFGGPEHVLKYLGGYTHRVAISNHRLVTFEHGQVTFRWRDSARKNKKRLVTLSADEFLRRFLLHVLPRGFVRIRHFGFLANRRRATFLPLCLALLSTAAPIPSTTAISSCSLSAVLWKCRFCNGPMIIIERLTSTQIHIRPPPSVRKSTMRPLSTPRLRCTPLRACYSCAPTPIFQAFLTLHSHVPAQAQRDWPADPRFLVLRRGIPDNLRQALSR
jgi:hypothetical protein